MGVQMAASVPNCCTVRENQQRIRGHQLRLNQIPQEGLHKGLNAFKHDDKNIFSNNKPLKDSVSFLFYHIKRRELTAFVLGDASL